MFNKTFSSISSIFNNLNNLTTKSANYEKLDIPLQLYSGDYVKNNRYTPQELVQLNKNWIFIANNKNANTIATTPIKLYYKKYSNKKLLVNNKPVEGKEDVVEILEHPFLDLLKNINPTMNYTDFTYFVQSYLGLIGNSYVRVIKENNLIKELEPLLAEHVIIVTGRNNKIIAYKYFNKTIAPEDIIQFSNYMPGNNISGRGELESCIEAAVRYNYYDAAESALNANFCRPDFIVSYKNQLSEYEKNNIEKGWIKKFSRTKNQGKPLITSDADIKTLGYAPREMSYPEGRKSCINEILATFGVPDALVTLNAANLASSYSATNHYYKYTIIPKLSKYLEKINEVLLPLYDENLYCWFEHSISVDPTEEASLLKSYVDGGIITINEAREKLGMQPIKEEDVKEEEVPIKEESKEERSE